MCIPSVAQHVVLTLHANGELEVRHCVSVVSSRTGMGVRIPAPSEGREGCAEECTQALADGRVALKECMRRRAVGGGPKMVAECVQCSRGRISWVALAASDGM